MLQVDILKKEFDNDELDRFLLQYGNFCIDKLLSCPETPGLRVLLNRIYHEADVFVISGGAQDELRQIFKERDLSKYFKGIYGCPDKKHEIALRLEREGSVVHPAVFVGDNKYDYESAAMIGADFIFMKQFSEFVEWETFFTDKRHEVIYNLEDLM